MRKLLFLLSFFTCTALVAQKELSKDYSYAVSKPYKVFDAGRKLYFAKGNQALTIKIDNKETSIQKFDTEKPAFIKEKIYEKFFPKNYRIEEVLELDKRYYVFYSSWNGKDDKEQLFAPEVDFERGELLPDPKLIIEIDGKVAGKRNFSFFGGGLYDMIDGTQDKFDFLHSFDKKNLLIQYRKKPEVKSDTKSYDVIGLVTFDAGLQQLSDREIKMPYTERRLKFLDYQLDNEGNLYLLTKIFHDDSNDDKKKKRDLVANYHLELFFIKTGTNELKISKFENNDKFISKLWMFDSNKDFAVCGGFYSTGKGDYEDSDGVLAFKIDRTGRIYEDVYHEIPSDIINQYESEKTKKKNDKKEKKGEVAKFTDLILKDLVINEDGSLLLIGEQDYMTTHSSSGPNGMRTYTRYHYNDILVTKIGLKGELNWMKKIPKSQSGSSVLGGMSYSYFGANNSHYLVFLDNVKNIDLKEDQTPAGHTDGQGGYLTAVKISDADGSFTKASILNGRDIEDFQMHQFATSRVFKTSENSFMFEVYKKKKEDVMVKVILK